MLVGPLISASSPKVTATSVRLLDARPGAEAYAAGHLPGAFHARLDFELSAASAPGHDPARGGRHPLPALATWTAQLGRWGIGPDTTVVTYDEAAGGVAACRLWWLLRAVGHQRVAVLDGGLQAALAVGLAPTRGQPAAAEPRPPYPCERWQRPIVGLDEVDRLLQDPAWKVLDVRSRERWRGEIETLDPVAGRIPGTVNLPYAENLDATGRFKAPEVLRHQYLELLAGTTPEHLAVHCGSGVTACHTLLALELAGLDGASLYVGSFSEWCRSGRSLGKG